MKFRRFFGLSFTLVLLATVLAGLIFRQEISDYLKLRGYTPPPEIVALADNTTMNQGARRLFYVNHPQITSKEVFNEYCRGHDNEFTIVLGCYVHPGGIYLLDVTDERLDGIKEVTAAHELLHAAYERLNSTEQDNIDSQVLDFYDNLEDDRIRQTVDQYKRQDPAIVANELHSIIGTEVRNLTDDLESYYSRYFTDRLKVVSLSEQYEQAFVERRNKIRSFDAELAGLKNQIEALQAQLRQTDSELRVQRDYMNQLKSEDEVEAYNAQVPLYNAKVNRYNSDIAELSALIVRYNDIVQQRNSIAAEEAELVEAIDSREVVPEQQ